MWIVGRLREIWAQISAGGRGSFDLRAQSKRDAHRAVIAISSVGTTSIVMVSMK